MSEPFPGSVFLEHRGAYWTVFPAVHCEGLWIRIESQLEFLLKIQPPSVL